MSGAKCSISWRSANSRLRISRRSPSPRSTGDIIDFGDTGRELKVQNIEHFDFSGWDIALFAAGSGPAKIYAPKAAAAGCTVIDNSSLFRMEPDVPLIVPEVNPEAIDRYKKRNIIANPNCSTAQMVVALKPLHDAAGIKRVVVSTYQSVSGAGKEGMDELFEESRAHFRRRCARAARSSPSRSPSTSSRTSTASSGPDSGYDGYTKEELKMAQETNKILDPPTSSSPPPACACRCSSAIPKPSTSNSNGRFRSRKRRAILREAPGIMLFDKREDGGYITPIECVGEYATYVSRVRKDPTVDNGLVLWCVSDNLRKGAALNAVQIAELLGRRHLKKA